jgi:hypothetical protein
MIVLSKIAEGRDGSSEVSNTGAFDDESGASTG